MKTHLDMDGFLQSKEGIMEILELEEARYHQMLRKELLCEYRLERNSKRIRTS